MRTRSLRLLHPFPSVLVAALTAVIGFMAGGADAPGTVGVLALGMLLYQFVIGVTNDLADAAEDLAAKPWKPLPSGAVSRPAALAILAGCLGAALALTATLGWAAWLVGVAGLTCGLAYDLWLKRTPLSWAPYTVAFALVPIWVHLALDAWDDALWLAAPLSLALGLSVHLANQAPDVATGELGIPALLGERGSRAAAVALFLLVAVAVAVLRSGLPVASATALMTGAAVAAGGPFASRVGGRDGLFGLVSLGGCALAAAFLAGI